MLLKHFIFITIKIFMKTKTKKALALVATSAILLNSGIASAKEIGEIRVLDDASKNTKIEWNEQFPVTGISGSVGEIKVRAIIEPQIRMDISDKELNFGVLNIGEKAEKSLTIEVGTNAKDGVNLTVASTNAGMQNKADAGVKISSDASVDGMADSYTFKSVAGATDSTVAGFAATVLSETEITDTTARSIYKTNKPEAFSDGTPNDLTFTVWVEANAQTPAGEYEDLLTFTITGNF